MSAIKHSITRRTIVAAAAGAAGTAFVSAGKADDELPLRGPYRIEDWGKTWLNPNKDRVLARVPAIAMADIAGYWPQTTRPVRGPQEYAKRQQASRLQKGVLGRESYAGSPRAAHSKTCTLIPREHKRDGQAPLKPEPGEKQCRIRNTYLLGAIYSPVS